MRRLGFKHYGYDQDVWRHWYKKGKIEKVLKYARYFESFDDLPWNKVEFLETLDHSYPNSKFVLLIRDSDRWFESFYSFAIREGARPPDTSAIAKFESRNKQILDYFSGSNRQQLLTMNLENGDGYQQLCPFLEVHLIHEKFPHANKGRLPGNR